MNREQRKKSNRTGAYGSSHISWNALAMDVFDSLIGVKDSSPARPGDSDIASKKLNAEARRKAEDRGENQVRELETRWEWGCKVPFVWHSVGLPEQSFASPKRMSHANRVGVPYARRSLNKLFPSAILRCPPRLCDEIFAPIATTMGFFQVCIRISYAFSRNASMATLTIKHSIETCMYSGSSRKCMKNQKRNQAVTVSSMNLPY
jgi:hypothetical protein